MAALFVTQVVMLAVDENFWPPDKQRGVEFLKIDEVLAQRGGTIPITWQVYNNFNSLTEECLKIRNAHTLPLLRSVHKIVKSFSPIVGLFRRL